MDNTWAAELLGRLSASLHLLRVSLRRLFWSRQTIISAVLVLLACVAVYAWARDRERSPHDFVQEVLLTVYVPFLLPILCLSYAAAGIATDRDEQTLVYLLTSPLPRPFIFLAKAAAAMGLSLAWTMGSLALLAAIARKPGLTVFGAVWPGLFWATVAYASLFQVFSVAFRRATIYALGYALFLETLIGNMPGIVKRLAISFYAKCVIFEASAGFDVGPSGPYSELLFQPLPAATAYTVLYAASAGLLLLGLAIFCTREY
jgi:ABC-2 type transport system permease protein